VTTAKKLQTPAGSWGDRVRPVLAFETDENLRSWMRLVLE
jgi:hypothetical protein